MKAFEVTDNYSIDSLALIERDHPKLSPRQILVKMRAVSLNYRDLLVVNGIDNWKPPVGRVPVSDGVGIIAEVGNEVTTLVVGDRVAGLFLPNWIEGKLTPEKTVNSLGGKAHDGVLQEYVVFEESAVIKVPSFLSDAAAATLPCAGLTAWHGLIEKGNAGPVSTVLIQGTGGISLFSLQFALMIGAEVILISSSDQKLELAKKMGVKHLINYKSIPKWEDKVMEITNGVGVDHVVEVVGSDNINRSIEVVSLDGTISVIGLIDGFYGNINTAKIMSKEIRLQGIEVGSKEMFARMNKAIEVNKIQPVIEKVYSFDDARHALSSLQKGAHFGKISLTF
ncbi:NADPH:quinone reductase-like Zn-dependent oxidoreductase [Mucilaginibacter frigoritolerans]|uniref:NADPH:quinone reductase-like Zn-dependent oxidoreductase n=1 Tax=Mucilaginibacter frigoritolerans TaxID=652788 RepID=A0A562TK85_9SPHI|nr:NAD(P)-dependent alcohol dehydrogenase [Mucilaginibacter frigoritolerans]TWI93935.1 NADPH:quinone reductase-like Zn-dependent oxidoreductase [Mucilaginibacter frigoritolerans]